MTAATLLINAGEVIDVQLTSETVVIDTPMGRRPTGEPGHITNRMRLFVREEGKEEIYDFEETNLGVREGQRVAIVRARMQREPAPINLLLFNLSSNSHEPVEAGLRIYLRRKRFFGPAWKAAALALVTAIVAYLVSTLIYQRTSVSAGFIAAAFACLFPAYWWLWGAWDRITDKMRYKAARTRLITEMSARVQAYAAPAAPPLAT